MHFSIPFMKPLCSTLIIFEISLHSFIFVLCVLYLFIFRSRIAVLKRKSFCWPIGYSVMKLCFMVFMSILRKGFWHFIFFKESLAGLMWRGNNSLFRCYWGFFFLAFLSKTPPPNPFKGSYRNQIPVPLKWNKDIFFSEWDSTYFVKTAAFYVAWKTVSYAIKTDLHYMWSW